MFVDQCVSSAIIAKPCVVLMAPAIRMDSLPFQYRFSEFTIFLLTGFFACTVSLNAGADPVRDPLGGMDTRQHTAALDSGG